MAYTFLHIPMCVCVSGYAFRPLTTCGDETCHGVRGQGPIVFRRSPEVKDQVKFHVARFKLKIWGG